MTTVYHDDSTGRLTADHYCNAANQPRLKLAQSQGERLSFILSPSRSTGGQSRNASTGFARAAPRDAIRQPAAPAPEVMRAAAITLRSSSHHGVRAGVSSRGRSPSNRRIAGNAI